MVADSRTSAKEDEGSGHLCHRKMSREEVLVRYDRFSRIQKLLRLRLFTMFRDAMLMFYWTIFPMRCRLAFILEAALAITDTIEHVVGLTSPNWCVGD